MNLFGKLGCLFWAILVIALVPVDSHQATYTPHQWKMPVLQLQPNNRRVHVRRRNSPPITFEITTRTRNPAAVTIPLDHSVKQTWSEKCLNFSPLQLHSKFKMAFGISFDRSNNNQSKIIRIGKNAQNILMHGAGLIFNLSQLKHCVMIAIWYNKSNEIGVYINLMDKFVRMTLRVYFALSEFKNPSTLNVLLSTIKGTSFYKEHASTKDLVLTILAYGVAAFYTVGFFMHRMIYDPIDYIEEGGNSMMRFFLTWNSTDYMEGSSFQVGFGITAAMGLFRIFINLVGNFIEQTAKLSLFTGVISLASFCENFTFKKTPPGLESAIIQVPEATGEHSIIQVPEAAGEHSIIQVPEADGEHSIIQVPEAAGEHSIIQVPEADGKHSIIKRYEELKQISRAINKAFFPILRIIMLGILFMSASFIDLCFQKGDAGVKKCTLFAELVIACIMYYLANECATTGDRFRGWMKMPKNRAELKLSQLDVIEEEQSPQTIGMGKGALFIKDAFLVTFTSAVAVYFLGIVETRPKPDVIQYVYCIPHNTTLL